MEMDKKMIKELENQFFKIFNNRKQKNNLKILWKNLQNKEKKDYLNKENY